MELRLLLDQSFVSRGCSLVGGSSDNSLDTELTRHVCNELGALPEELACVTGASASGQKPEAAVAATPAKAGAATTLLIAITTAAGVATALKKKKQNYFVEKPLNTA